MRSGKEKVFVYGTLKPGFHFGDMYLSQWECSGQKAIRGSLHMVNCGTYAGLNLNGNDVVYGYIFNVDSRMLKVLDKVEGCPNFYQRKKVTALYSGEEVWTYEYVNSEEFEEDNRIEHGTFEYVKGLYDKFALLQPQTGNHIKAMIGGMPLMIQNPLTKGGNHRLPGALFKHPAPTVNVSINDGEITEALLLNPFEFYDHATEGIDLMLPSGEILTGIPTDNVIMFDE